MTQTTWPDPGKPGVPMHPEKDGWHWLKTGHGLAPWYWVEDQGAQGCFGWETDDDISPPDMLARYGTTYLGPVLTPDEATALQARVAKLEGALKDAAASVGEWGAYASQYIQDKFDLPGEVARYIAIAEGKNDAALEGKKDE